MLRAQDGMSSSEFHNRTIQSRLSEVEARFVNADTNNAQLRKDKQILVEHTSQLQKKVGICWLAATKEARNKKVLISNFFFGWPFPKILVMVNSLVMNSHYAIYQKI